MTSTVIYSTDEFFMRAGVYTFDASKLSAAHAWCLRLFIDSCRSEYEAAQFLYPGEEPYIWPKLYIIDNTNTSVVELAPYVAIAQAYGLDVEIHELVVDVEAAHARSLHGVPLEAMQKMHDRMQSEALPPWWKRVTLNEGTPPSINETTPTSLETSK